MLYHFYTALKPHPRHPDIYALPPAVRLALPLATALRCERVNPCVNEPNCVVGEGTLVVFCVSARFSLAGPAEFYKA